MTSSRPYLLRAIYEWLLDNSQTPYLMVNASEEGVVVPNDFIENGKIVLNIEATAVGNFRMGNDAVEFDARFKGRPFHVFLPLPSIMAIYSFENGRGMVFGEEDHGGDDGSGGEKPSPTSPTPSKKGRPNLKVIK